MSPGTRVGGARYILKRLLGRGEFSEVWLVQDVKNGREAALKFLPRIFLSDANLLERFKQQVQRNLLFVHPHIAATYAFSRDHFTAAIATEFVDGWSLATLKVDKLCRCYSVEEITPWLRQLCAALDYAHNQFGIVHSALKPANLLLNAQEQLKVTDFGIAQSLRTEGSRRGLAKGAPGGLGFLSPQQVMGADPSQTDDIYSLGATIFDLLTGTPPFHKGEIIAQICSLKPPSMTQRLAKLKIQAEPIPPVWEDTVARCLAKDPDDRPHSAAEVLQLLERKEMRAPVEGVEIEIATPVATETVAPAGVQSAQPVEMPSAMTPRQKFKLPLVIGIAAAFAVAIVAAGIFAIGKSKHAGADAVTQVAVASETNSSVPPAKLPMLHLFDTSFLPGIGSDKEINSLLIEPNGEILVGGTFTTFDGQPYNHIVRLLPNGVLDTDFAAQAGADVEAMAVWPDGRILIGGDFMNVSGIRRRHIALLNPDGIVDRNFTAGCDGEVRALAIQPDGQILIGGNFTRFDGKRDNRIARVDPQGGCDPAFDVGLGADAKVVSIALQRDGKILLAGLFTKFDGTPVGRLVRLNPDGTLDTTFDTGTGANDAIIKLAVLPDGKVLAAGDFSSFNGTLCNHIVRLNSDGSVDQTFNSAAGPNDEIHDLAVLPDDRILVVGTFTSVGETPCDHIARLNANGGLDLTLDTSSVADGIIWGVACQPDGKILVGGGFKNFGGVRCGGIARMNN
ncbi:MAG TPA: protein kinase [Candidatus Aquilonibacter sp.]|nr:protein kinase [Candidatus Aquilonibacter sp.]